MSEVDEKLFVFFDGLPAQSRLKSRLINLLNEWSKLVIDNLKKQQEYRFLMSIGKRSLKIEFIHGQVSVEIFSQPKLLLDSLSQQSSDEFEYVLDEHLNLPNLVKRVIAKPADQNINCYIIKKSNHHFDVLVKDSKGHIFYQRYQRTDEKYLVSYYRQFIDNIRLSSGFLAGPNLTPVFYVADASSADKKARFIRLKSDSIKLPKVYWSVRAVACLNSEYKVCFDLYAGEQGYRYNDYGELAYRKLAQTILASRQLASNQYPIFITNLDLSAVLHDAQLPHYFEYKRLVEQKLEKAINQLNKKKISP